MPPTLAITNDGTGTSVTAAVTGGVGATHTLYYATPDDSEWTAGESRVGDGDIAQGGLTADTWHTFVVVSDDTAVPSLAHGAYVHDPTALTAAGALTYAKDDLQTLVAASATFQNWVGAAGATEAERRANAALRVYLDIEESPARPFAAVHFGQPAEIEDMAKTGGSAQFMSGGDRGTVELVFEAAVDTTHSTPADQLRAFERKVDAILEEMKALAGTDGFLIVRAIRIADGPARYGTTDGDLADGDFYQVGYAIEYGGGDPA